MSDGMKKNTKQERLTNNVAKKRNSGGVVQNSSQWDCSRV